MKKIVSSTALLLLAACAASRAPHIDAASFVLLGEVHDNAEAHAAQAAALRSMLADGRPTTVVFEQMGRAQNAAIAAAPREAEALVDAGQLDRKGWRWPLHKPVVDAALAGGARIAGGNLSRDEARRAVREGEAALPASVRALLDRSPWSDAQQQAMVAEIADSHCGALPETMHAPMALAQRARDAAMAQAMLDARAAGAQRVVLIAGNGHVRRDSAVPVYLQAAGVPAADIFSVAALEGDAAAAETGRYDRAVRTGTAAREDPCHSLRSSSSQEKAK